MNINLDDPSISPSVKAIVESLPPFMKLADAARVLGVDVSTVIQWHRVGRIEAVRTSPGSKTRLIIFRSEIARLLSSMGQPAPEDGV